MLRAVKVLIDGAAGDLTFSYRVPDSITVATGQRVVVMLRNRRTVATVTEVEELDPASLKYELKPIESVVAEDSFLSGGLLELARWIARFYLTSVETVVRTMLPKPSQGEEEKRKTRRFARLVAGVGSDTWAELGPRMTKQKELCDFLLENGSVLASDLTGPMGYSSSSLKALIERGWVEMFDQIVGRDPLEDIEYVESIPLVLNPEQAAVLAQVQRAGEVLRRGETARPILLHGVTGSGKTEVYLQAIQQVVDQGMGAIVLVPEIALTPQTADRFKQRFAKIKDEVAILHSNLSEGERHDEWRKVLDGRARIVIGARSAIFSPVANLGLIVVDEEHEGSYKQDTVPRYQARDIAVVRGGIERCPVLLGSATPSLESWQNVLSGKYELATMRLRVDDRKLPLIRVIDMKLESRKQGAGLTILATRLREGIEKRLADGEQIILLLNRRGFARNILCTDCGYVATCQHCSTTMTLHKGEDKLVCHICGFSHLPPRRCPECRSQSISNAGIGTERVEEMMRQVFPTARIARVDTDTMRKKGQLRETLTAFRAKKLDILLGTQMIAKGLDFPNVTLVGVLNADVGLHIPDFRAGERTFQLLTQVAGRAGRGELEGEVIVQTYTPHHPAIQFSRHHDFEGFAEQELVMRRQFGHPPFIHMILITARSKNQQRADLSLRTLHGRLKADLPTGVSLTEPLPSPLEKSHDQWRFQIILKSAKARSLAGFVRDGLSGLTFPDDVIVTVDVDPYNLS